MTTPPVSQYNDDSLAERVLHRIESEQVRPRPRWEFIFENYFFWILGGIAVLLGALASSAMIFEVQNADWQYAFITHQDTFSFFFDVAPVLWIVCLTLFIGIGYINVRRTQHGYRYSLPIIAVSAVLASLALGSVLYQWGFGELVENSAGTALPFHHSIIAREHGWWLAPEKGLLGGTVVKGAPDLSSFELRDFSGAIWHINASDLRTPDLAAVVRGGVVRVVGLPATASSSALHACFVFPWEEGNAAFGGPPPLPLGIFSSSSPRAAGVPQSDACKRIAPYARLQNLDTDGGL